MKQAIAIVAVVAILGVIGLEASNTKGNSSAISPASSTSNVQPVASRAAAASSNSVSATSGKYKDGTFTGASIENEFGSVQIAAVISGGKLTDIKYIQMPGGRGHTEEVTSYSEPILKSEAVQAQSASIDFISGATVTSMSFEQSLQAALNQAVQS